MQFQFSYNLKKSPARNEKLMLVFVAVWVQMANFLLLFIAKDKLSDAEFTIFLVQAAIAGVLNSLATLRIEVIVFQKYNRLTLAGVYTPFVAALIITGLSYGGALIMQATFGLKNILSPWTSLLIVGGALAAAQDFIFVQCKRVNLLVVARVFQGVLIIILCVAINTGNLILTGGQVVGLQGLAMIITVLIVLGGFCYSRRGILVGDAPLLKPDREMLTRASSLSGSAMVNSLFTNLPILGAGAILTVTSAADFGFIMRVISAPVTLIKNVNGKIFLRQSLEWQARSNAKISELRKIIRQTMFQGVIIFIVLATLLLAGVCIYEKETIYRNFSVVIYLLIANLLRAAISPISQVRVALKDEIVFGTFDILRVAILAATLFSVGYLFSYEAVFGFASLGLYTTYVVFIELRLRSWKGNPK